MDMSSPGLSWPSQAAVTGAQASICGTCVYWQPHDREHDYCAPCAMGYGAPPFNYSCSYHIARSAAPAGLSQQSQARGMSVQEWQQRLTGRP